MGVRELKAAYGKSRGVMNSAIRAELPGGDAALDSLAFFHEMKNRLNRDGLRESPQAAVAQLAMDRLGEVAQAMEAEIRKRYGIPPMEA